MKLLDYIKGNRRGINAHRLEREAMSDPFLSDALEGYDSVAGDHSGAIDRLRDAISRRSVSRHRRRYVWAAAGVAAVLLLFLTLGRQFLPQDQQQPDQIVPYLAEMINTTAELPEQLGDSTAAPAFMELADAVVVPGDSQAENRRQVAPETDMSSRPVADEEKEAPRLKAVSDVLTISFEDTGEGVWFDTAEKEQVALKSSAPVAQMQSRSLAGKAVYGRVLDVAGKPIAGASVIVYIGDVPSSRGGDMTDAEGHFSVTVPPNGSLQISFMGYKSMVVTSKEPNQTIILEDELTELEAVVSLGFRQGKLKDQTGAVSVIDPEELKDYLAGDLASSLRGLVPGLEVINQGRRGDSTSAVVIRSVNENGGYNAMKDKEYTSFGEYLQKNLKPVYDADNNQIVGKVVLEFRVDGRGRPVRIQVSKSLSKEADKEAERLLKEGPDWELFDGKTKVTIEFK